MGAGFLGGFQNGSRLKERKKRFIEEAKELKGLNDVRVAYLGKRPTTVLRGMGKLFLFLKLEGSKMEARLKELKQKR